MHTCYYCGQTDHPAYQIDESMVGLEMPIADLRDVAREFERRTGIPTRAVTDSYNGANNCPGLVAQAEQRLDDLWAAVEQATK